MSGCRSRQDLTFQYPCSLRFPLQAGGTEPLRGSLDDDRVGWRNHRHLQAGGTEPLRGSPREAGGT